MAPETKFENARYGSSIDVFSFGHLTIHTAIQTWPQVFEVEDVQSIDRGKIEVTKRKQALEAMRKNGSLHPLAISCLHDSANGRPSCIEVNRQLVELSQKYPCSIDEIHFTAECLTGSVEASSVIRGDNEQVLLQQNKELRQQYDSLKKDIPLMEEALKSSKEENEKLNGKLFDQETEIQSLKATIEGFKEQKVNYDNVIDEIEKEKIAFEIQAQNYEMDFQIEREDRARAHGRIDDLESKLAIAEARIEQQKSEIENLYKECGPGSDLQGLPDERDSEVSRWNLFPRLKHASRKNEQATRLLQENESLRQELAQVTTQLRRISDEQRALSKAGNKVKPHHHSKKAEAIKKESTSSLEPNHEIIHDADGHSKNSPNEPAVLPTLSLSKMDDSTVLTPRRVSSELSLKDQPKMDSEAASVEPHS